MTITNGGKYDAFGGKRHRMLRAHPNFRNRATRRPALCAACTPPADLLSDPEVDGGGKFKVTLRGLAPSYEFPNEFVNAELELCLILDEVEYEKRGWAFLRRKYFIKTFSTEYVTAIT